MPDWKHLIEATDCPAGTAQEVLVDGRVLAVFNVEGTYYALDGICPHQGGPLGKGQLNGCVVTCPWHGWQFNVATGQQQINDRIVHTTYPLRHDGDDIYIQFPA